jgi:hypothetical protein
MQQQQQQQQQQLLLLLLFLLDTITINTDTTTTATNTNTTAIHNMTQQSALIMGRIDDNRITALEDEPCLSYQCRCVALACTCV